MCVRCEACGEDATESGLCEACGEDATESGLCEDCEFYVEALRTMDETMQNQIIDGPDYPPLSDEDAIALELAEATADMDRQLQATDMELAA